jgi:hypothetical protein
MLIELTHKAALRKDGKWQKLDIEYIRDGKKQKKTLVAIADTKEVVRKLVQDFNEGDNIEVTLKKSDDGEFWNWVDVTAVVGQQAAAKTSTQVRGGWETPEERAKKQVYIVRQSSIANALELHKNNAKLTVKEVLATAAQFEDYVFGAFEDADPIVPKKEEKPAVDKDFEDDIPF